MKIGCDNLPIKHLSGRMMLWQVLLGCENKVLISIITSKRP